MQRRPTSNIFRHIFIVICISSEFHFHLGRWPFWLFGERRLRTVGCFAAAEISGTLRILPQIGFAFVLATATRRTNSGPILLATCEFVPTCLYAWTLNMSQWSTPFVTGIMFFKWKFCVNYICLNQATLVTVFPIPRCNNANM